MDKRTIKSKGNLGEYTKPKWELGKTVAIRIPEVLKDKVLEVARYFDGQPKKQIKQIDLVSEIENNKSLNDKVYKLHNDNTVLRNRIEDLMQRNQDLSKQLEKYKKKNKYQLSNECFKEYLAEIEMTLAELEASRKGTKKRQLLEISQWFDRQSKEAPKRPF